MVREGESLTLINSVRLDEAGLAALERLGNVKHVVKLGAFHGMDDAFYVERYGALQWGLPGMEHEGARPTSEGSTSDSGATSDATSEAPKAPARATYGLRPQCEARATSAAPQCNARPADRTLSATDLPIAGASLFVFETSQVPEGLLLLPVAGGVLVSCDSLQNWVAADEFFNEESAAKMKEIGFIRPANIGPGWRMASKATAKDFERLAGLPFRNLLPAHGIPIVGTAHAELSATFQREYELATLSR